MQGELVDESTPICHRLRVPSSTTLPPWFTPEKAHLVLGKRGERIASKYLRSLGYILKGRNVRLGKDEIDIIAFDPQEEILIFAEVKTRTTLSEDYPPALNVSAKKRKRLRRSARAWVDAHDYDGAYRLDVLCVAEGRVVQHLQDLAWENDE